MALVSKSWADIVRCLAEGSPMPEKYRDHALTGNWASFRDCHVKPDLVLVYRILGNAVELHRLGTHAELF
ncbi:type II toxin-antitoxin system YafQ family toxin [Neisseria chenwenguii]|uniref:Type II toxin-antitoxin system mRNA interferase toxin, RelE/StbE family n=1 Tax=Neisseria chenwenguii TaxID=1853278 RepID=A0A220S1V1_9NEIS|nr:type II toxin-antitoxin system YafQ family toxin [Neisseria chenwenguii]ASK27346.1 type II toxin-antitoxin system mRNA interferase toxin, RelE/StbE family [Neisseria chenwenguii]ROV56981.1 type II toxin-antitoxin system YafQ family toxin [Neisseria chenwenguii]